MYRLLTTSQVRELESRAINALGITERELMLTAGGALADAVEAEIDLIYEARGLEEMSLKSKAPKARVVVVCGPGNNGGDGWACAWSLHRRGVPVAVYALVDPTTSSGPAADIAYETVAAGVPWHYGDVPQNAEPFSSASVIVDALLGTGSSLPLRESVAQWCEAINRSGLPVISADVPTGVDADTGLVDPHAVIAHRTITFVAPKIGLMFAPGALHAGRVDVVDLGVGPVLHVDFPGAPDLYTDAECGRAIPLPQHHHNKFSRGRLLVFAGSSLFTGAAILTAHAAARSGAGYVTVATPAPVVPVLQTHLVTTPVVGLPVSRDGQLSPKALPVIRDLSDHVDAVVVGPGLGNAPSTVQLVRDFVALLSDANAAGGRARPLLLDADGLNAFAGHADLLSAYVGPIVLTPHAGEMARLLGLPTNATINQLEPVPSLTGEGLITVAKGSTTVVRSGRYSSADRTAPAAMATAGTGDVLSGIIGGLLAQGVEPYLASCVGVRIHSKAGVIASEELTPVSMTALDVVDYLPFAIADLLDAALLDEEDVE